jgi:hypothetical protein
MYIKKEITRFEELKENSWSGAVDTLNRIEELKLEDEFMNILEECFDYSGDETPTDTDVNDFIWFETEYINELLSRNCDDLFDDEEEDEDED